MRTGRTSGAWLLLPLAGVLVPVVVGVSNGQVGGLEIGITVCGALAAAFAVSRLMSYVRRPMIIIASRAENRDMANKLLISWREAFGDVVEGVVEFEQSSDALRAGVRHALTHTGFSHRSLIVAALGDELATAGAHEGSVASMVIRSAEKSEYVTLVRIRLDQPHVKTTKAKGHRPRRTPQFHSDLPTTDYSEALKRPVRALPALAGLAR